MTKFLSLKLQDSLEEKGVRGVSLEWTETAGGKQAEAEKEGWTVSPNLDLTRHVTIKFKIIHTPGISFCFQFTRKFISDNKRDGYLSNDKIMQKNYHLKNIMLFKINLDFNKMTCWTIKYFLPSYEWGKSWRYSNQTLLQIFWPDFGILKDDLLCGAPGLWGFDGLIAITLIFSSLPQILYDVLPISCELLILLPVS